MAISGFVAMGDKHRATQTGGKDVGTTKQKRKERFFYGLGGADGVGRKMGGVANRF